MVAPCGLDLEASQQSAEALGRLLGERGLSTGREADAAGGVAVGGVAVASASSHGAAGAGVAGGRARILAFDGRLWFSRPGPRLVDGAEALAGWLNGSASPDGVTSLEISQTPS